VADPPCPICDTFWRLYGRAVENLHELVRKHRDERDRADKCSCEMLEYEIAIAESTLHSIRAERRRHERRRHALAPPRESKPQGREPRQAGQPDEAAPEGRPAGSW